MGDFYDKNKEVLVREGKNLPHMHQEECIQYVTMRLADSLPASTLYKMKEFATSFKNLNPQPWTEEVEKRYWNIIGKYESKYLDAGYGSCIFSRPEVRKIVAEALHYYDRLHYELIAYVIMPNHIHMLFKPFPGIISERILNDFIRYSTRIVNKIVGREGKLLQREPFDRMVRNEDHQKHCISYIRANPINLPPDSYTLYLKE